MLKRVLLCLLLLGATQRAAAIDYTDIWYQPAESGWGVNVVQSGSFMFLTFFVYGPDKRPTWYTGQLTMNAAGAFTGPLYATTGTFYGAAWAGSDLTLAQVGTATFQPGNASTATLTYAVTTPGSMAANVTRTIQRQTLTPIPVVGTYVGAQAGAYSACTST